MSGPNSTIPVNLHEVPAAEPPLGVISNLINPPNHNKNLIVQHSICLTLVTLAVGIRLYTRAFITHNLGWDDSIPWGFGRHIWDVPADEILPQQKIGFVTEIIYLPLSLAIKMSFLLFFGRIFAIKNSIIIKRLIHGGIAVNVIFYTAYTLLIIVTCRHVQPGHNCQSETLAPYTAGVWSFAADLFLLILPLSCLWRLQMNRDKKLKLAFIFSVGVLACTASGLHFVYAVKLENSTDATWDFATLSVWSSLEIHTGLICACLPAFIPFYEHTFSNGFCIKTCFSKIVSFLLAGLSRSSSSSPSFYNDTNPIAPSAPSTHGYSNTNTNNNRIVVTSDYDVVVVEGNPPPLEDMAGVGGFRGFRDVGDKAHLTASVKHSGGGERGNGGTAFAMQRFK